MNVTALIYAILHDYSGTYDGFTYDAGDKVHVIFNTSTLAFTVDLYDSDGTIKGSPDDGPNLNAYKSFELVTEEPFYSYCDGTTLKSVTDVPTTWPYGSLISTANYYACVVEAPVCDLEIGTIPVIVSASSPTTNDGSITVTATSTAGGSNVIENGSFNTELSPATSEGSGNAWTWSGAFSGCAFNTLPSSLSPTQRLRIPYNTVTGVEYTFELTTRATDGGGGAGNYTDWKLYLTDGVDFSCVQTQANQPLGTTIFEISITPSADFPYIEITAESNNVAGQDREVLVLLIAKVGTNGGVKFSLTDFNYNTEGQTSGLFSSLYPGVYTIYAKDANGCYDTLSVRVPVIYTYGVYYRMEFDDGNNYATHRVDILKRGFVGSLTEVCGAGEPLKINYNGSGEGKYSPLIGSSAVVGLMSESNQQFSELFLGDDRQFQVKYYRDSELRWMGYIIPSMYEEPYIAPPYPVFFTATDGLGDLKNFDLLNDVDERYRGEDAQIYIIKEILNKLNLGINIHSGVNVFETTMDQAASDDPLIQAYVDTDAYYGEEPEEDPLDCDSVLHGILKPYGARLFQAKGVWWIVRTQEMEASFAYRVFNSEGVYQSNSTYDPLRDFSSGSDINRAVPRDKAGLLLIIPGYGEITITQELGLRNNLLKSGEFEEDDLIPTGIGTQMFFMEWTIEQNTEGITYGLERVTNGDSRGAFYMDFLSASDNDYNLLKSSLVDIEASPTDKLKFSFQYLVRPSIEAKWVRFGYNLFGTDGVSATLYFNAKTNTWDSYGGTEMNEIYADKFDEWSKVDFLMPAPEGVDKIELRFYLQANNRTDYTDIADLPNTDPFGTKRTVLRVINTGSHISYYTYTDTLEDEDLPNIVEPSGGGGRWKLDQTIQFTNDFSILNSILIDNAVIGYLPSGEDPPETDVQSYLNSDAIKTNYSETVMHGDLGDISNGENIYKNYLRLSDGTPTELWSRDGVEEKKLLKILLDDYTSQLSTPNYRIQSPIFYDIDMTFLITFEDQFDGGRKYIPNSLEMDVFNNTANIEMIELLNTSAFEFNSDFNSDFNIE